MHSGTLDNSSSHNAPDSMRGATQLVEQEGDDFYARALARSCAQAHVKKLRCDD